MKNPVSALLFFFFVHFQTFCQELPVEITSLVPNHYVHTTYQLIQNNPFPSNGLIVSTSVGIVLVDTGWGLEQTEKLLAQIEQKLKQKVVLCIVTHAHEDRIGGVKAFQQRGIKIIGTPLTAQKTVAQGLPAPEGILPQDTTFRVGDTTIQTYFPGAGHTDDNIVIYFPNSKVLVGGCLIKSYVAMGIGNIADANLKTWKQSVNNVRNKFPNAEFVIPGHEKWDNLTSFSRTIELVEQNSKK
ncbi:subclass B1 metallo-beta-lactamase [Runella slithyformis]|uniref:beta-lactamase n=1 Tax=Runella slithyformis (strain ATCC 29530 / DSM 19594 / LMG 11500 / NCIMB 11436 / LSU 4) TaxID=761193 RepID=A0A7U4E7J1_RUNSL|nr:subclass B1 metallo-beta-lactamase [Runella slithyformis]AEI50718.1 Beta-lactamase [Runella slithyformis DSM 19594]